MENKLTPLRNIDSWAEPAKLGHPIIDGYLWRGEVSALVGATGSGKSTRIAAEIWAVSNGVLTDDQGIVPAKIAVAAFKHGCIDARGMIEEVICSRPRTSRSKDSVIEIYEDGSVLDLVGSFAKQWSDDLKLFDALFIDDLSFLYSVTSSDEKSVAIECVMHLLAYMAREANIAIRIAVPCFCPAVMNGGGVRGSADASAGAQNVDLIRVTDEGFELSPVKRSRHHPRDLTTSKWNVVKGPNGYPLLAARGSQ